MTDTGNKDMNIAGRTLEQWEEHARRDDCLDSMVPGDLRVLISRIKVDENTSDGYHTFKELYDFRKLYNANLFNEWARQGINDVHKSEKHSDGELCFGGGWFIVMATTEHGQISNHYPMGDWDLFECTSRSVANEWDGHTSEDVAKTLKMLAVS